MVVRFSKALVAKVNQAGAALRRPEIFVFLPALTLAAFWLGGEKVLFLTALGAPLIFVALPGQRKSGAAAAMPDVLEGLALRGQIISMADAILRDSQRTGRSTACLVLQFDQADHVVEQHGRVAQTEVLIRSAERICGALRAGDIVARLEGGGFAVALAPARRFDVETVVQVAARLQAAIAAPISLNATNIYATCSVGLCLGDRAPTASGLGLLNAAQVAALDARYGRPIGFRWRCAPCGPREYVTDTKTFRVAAGIDGPLPLAGWDYRVGASYARSESSSVLGSGYYYRGTLANGASDPNAPTAPGATAPGLVGVINSGLINPFSLTQTEAGLAALEAVSAKGATLYGGRYQLKQVDASFSGPLFALPGGDVQMAVGVDYRRETYEFNGSPAAAATAPVIFLAAFDNVNALTPKNRDVKAAYAEINVPVFDMLELTGAVRIDDYSGFGTTTNPKVSAKFQPAEWVMFRGSYSTGFRVPSFNQIFNGITESPYSGSDLADPVKCPGGVPNATNPACAFIRPNIWTGGTIDLGPETAKMASLGVVLRPAPRWTASVDWWSIRADNTIQLLTLRQLIDNAALFPDRFIRDGSGTITTIDQRWINAGARKTQGLEISLRGGFDLPGNSQLNLGADGTMLLEKKEKLTPTSAWSASQIGVFTFAGDLGLRWKHNAWLTWSNDNLSATFSQIFRKGYKNQALPGIAAGTITRPDYNPMVKDYAIYNLTVSYQGLIEGLKLTAGVKNVFDTDPPFAITYDGNTGAGSSWEPRVADPRGRSFILQAEMKF